ncbi:MAG: hypothetical protein AAGI06_12725 [Pseudomonadota bacterium]
MRKVTLSALALLCCCSMAAWAFAVAEDTRTRVAEEPATQTAEQSIAIVPSE